MRTALLALSLLLVACADRPLEYNWPTTTSLPIPVEVPCGRVGQSCCLAKSGCDTDPQTGLTVFTDCVSPPGEADQGICVSYAACGNPNGVCCNYAGDPDPSGDFCEYGYHCNGGRCVFTQ